MLDLDALRRASLERRPFAWALAEPAFTDRRLAGRLAASFPVHGFTWSEGAGEKGYRMGNRDLVRDGAIVEDGLAGLSAAWRALVRQLVSPPYRAALAEATGASLERCAVEARLCRYGPGCWMDAHTDRPEKSVTHVVYLSEHWDPAWGGELRILRSPDPDDVAATVAPELGRSVLIVRSDVSWHAVAHVRPGVEAERTSLLVHLVHT